MPTPVNSVLVLIASPGDAMEERASVRDALSDWSVTTGLRQGVVVLPWLYERHVVARMGDRAQALINSQAVDKVDVVVAFFDSRLGSHTGMEVSGTAEEISRAVKLGKPVHVYFSNEDIPRNVDVAQLAALQEFQQKLRDEGLLGNYTDPIDLTGQVTRAIQADIDQHGWGQDLAATTQAGAQLVWEHVRQVEQTGTDNKGRIKARTRRNALVVRNPSDVDAEGLTFMLSAVDGNDAYRFDGPDEPVTVHARSEMQWTLIPLEPVTIEVYAEWTENGIPRKQTRTFTTQ